MKNVSGCSRLGRQAILVRPVVAVVVVVCVQWSVCRRYVSQNFIGGEGPVGGGRRRGGIFITTKPVFLSPQLLFTYSVPYYASYHTVIVYLPTTTFLTLLPSVSTFLDRSIFPHHHRHTYTYINRSPLHPPDAIYSFHYKHVREQHHRGARPSPVFARVCTYTLPMFTRNLSVIFSKHNTSV